MDSVELCKERINVWSAEDALQNTVECISLRKFVKQEIIKKRLDNRFLISYNAENRIKKAMIRRSSTSWSIQKAAG